MHIEVDAGKTSSPYPPKNDQFGRFKTIQKIALDCEEFYFSNCSAKEDGRRGTFDLSGGVFVANLRNSNEKLLQNVCAGVSRNHINVDV